MNKKILFFLIAIFLLFFSGSFLIQKKAKNSSLNLSIKPEDKISKKIEQSFFSDLYIKNIKLDNDDESYVLESGDIFNLKGEQINDKEKINRILRLVLFYEWNKEDPLFNSPDFDWKQFEKSLDIIKKEKDFFLKTTGYKLYPFPFDFWVSLKNVAKKQNILRRELSEENARELIAALEKTNEKYTIESHALKNAIYSSPSRDDFLFLFLADIAVSKKQIIADFDKILENANILSLEINHRKLCLLNSIDYCQRIIVDFPEPSLRKTSNIQEEVELLDKDLLTSTPEFSSEDLRGPYEIETGCIGQISSEFKNKQYLYIAIAHNDIMGVNMLFLKSATNNYYTNNDSIVLADPGQEDERWRIIPEANPYTCTNFEYLPQAAITHKFFKEFKDKKIYPEIKNLKNIKIYNDDFKEIIKKGEIFENNFFSKKFPSYEDLELLSQFYGYTYSFIALNDYKNLDKYKEDLLNRYLIINRKMNNLDLMLNNFVFLLSNTARRYYIKNQVPPFSYTYLVRSSYSLTFLPFSPSVWRAENGLQYYIKYKESVLKKERHFLDYHRAIVKFGEKEVLTWHKYNNIPWVYNELFQEKIKNKINEE